MNEGLMMNRRFLRSINLGKDRTSKEGLTGYVITPSVRNALARINVAFVEKVTERAFTLTGPYGTGKSSFGLFLLNLLSDKKNVAWKMLQTVDSDLANSFKSSLWGKTSSKGFLALPVTARCAPVAELIADAFENSDLPISDSLRDNIECLRNSTDTKNSLSLIQACVKQVCSNGYKGVFLIVDELGKVFEEARRDNAKIDVFLLQELAEAASRSSDVPILFMGILHQSFADYAAQETTLRNEFSKIEGRFEPISFIEPIAAQINLIAAAFPTKNSYAQKDSLVKSLSMLVTDVKLPSMVGLSNVEFVEYMKQSLPLHPMALAALPLLFRRFGQNERSIFSFLTSNEPSGFQDFIKNKSARELFRLCDLFDYFFQNYEAHLASRSFGQPFMEAHAVIQSRSTMTADDANIIKSVAVLTSLGLQSPINATDELISAAMYPKEIKGGLSQLKAQSVLVYRKFNKTYSLWNGSDIDLHECCKEADEELSKVHFSVAETFRKFMPQTQVVAKRHSINNGSLRFFDTLYVDNPNDIKNIQLNSKSGAVGTIVVCLTTLPKWRNWFESEAKVVSSNNKTLIFAIPSDITDLIDALLEIRRLKWVETNVAELRDDRVARREVAVRLATAEQSVSQHKYRILDPRPAKKGGGGCRYIWEGKNLNLKCTREVSMMLSSVCDSLYSLSPIIKNELVNKKIISSQAAAARRVIVNALNNSDIIRTSRFGIQGYPPERSIYESVISQSGMHVETNGGYKLVAPNKDAVTKLRPAWDRIEKLVYTQRDIPLNLRELYDEMAKPPYGILEGMMPILTTAFYAVNRDEVSLYAEGTFLPTPSEAHFELLLRRPELFSISGTRICGIRKKIIERLGKGLQTETKILSVVRKLYAMMNSLTKYARETGSVSDQAQKFRKAFFDAKSPEKLLFKDIPESLGIGEILECESSADAYEQFFKRLNESLCELSEALPKLISENREILLTSCGFENSEEGWKLLYDKSSFLLSRIGGTDICPFLQNIVNTAGDWEKADAVMSYIQQMPISKWGVIQIAEFKKKASGIGERFKAAARPYDFVSEQLSRRELNEAAKLQHKFHELSNDVSPAVVRAALINYLEELQRKRGS